MKRGKKVNILGICTAFGGVLLGMLFDWFFMKRKYNRLQTRYEDTQKELEKYMEMAQMDLMCGIYNKGVLEERIKELLKEWVDTGKQAIIVVDIDDLKSINDTYGHTFGDEVIISVANLLKKHFNGTELIGRIGGDEFMVFVPYVRDSAQLKQRMGVFLEECNHLLIGNDIDFHVCCSLGATIIREDRNFVTLFQQADRALYEVKKKAKNGYALYYN